MNARTIIEGESVKAYLKRRDLKPQTWHSVPSRIPGSELRFENLAGYLLIVTKGITGVNLKKCWRFSLRSPGDSHPIMLFKDAPSLEIAAAMAKQWANDWLEKEKHRI